MSFRSLLLLTFAFSWHAFAAPEMHTRTFRVPPDFLSIGLPTSGDPVAPVDPFAAGQPEAADGKVPRQTARQVLEVQGVTFPEGSSAIFNPTTGLITVTNTQPNLDLVGAFIDTIQAHSPATLAHQLIIIEGPGDLIRQVNAAASRSATAAAELATLVGYVKNPGSNVRVVADAFLETKSGTHSTSAAVREHVYPTDLDLDTKSHASTSWDIRPLGLTLEVEPTLDPDGTTIENHLSIKFHPLTPRIRQLTATEPLTGRDAEHPFSVSAGTEFVTSLVSVSGAVKLIGVAKPVGLANEKSDVLWAAFFTTNIRHLAPLLQAQPSQTPAPAGLAAAIFHAPAGLLESLIETPSLPLRDWLEKEQGISFPPGALLEPKGDLLHVTNTPAMIEAFGALISAAEAKATKTIVFTLHTIEAPATLLRELALQSITSGADETMMFTTLEAAAARNEARFIDSLVLETKAGTRARLESVREHVFISEFAITDQNLPEISFDMRKVGTLVEIEPAISADGSTVEFNFTHEVHPAPPETRGAHFRDPASGKRFAMPATDFHVLKTSCGLSMTQGSTKLISLNQPTGRDTAGKLWATFLKCEVMAQIGSQRGEARVLHVPATTNNSGKPEEMYVRTYRLPPDFLSDPPVRRPHEKHAPKEFFEEQGISFPQGADAWSRNDVSGIWVRNTSSNLDLVEEVVKQILAKSNKTIVLTTHVLQAPGPLLRRLTAQTARKSNHRAELDELLADVKTGIAQSLGTNRIETKSGVIARAQQGVEHTAFSDVHISTKGRPEIVTETRNVGFKVELEATTSPDGQLLDINIAPEFHTAPPFEHREHILDTQGRRLEFPLTDFHVSNLATTITIPSGTTRLLSLHKPTGKPEFEKEDILQAIFITCDILRTGE